MGVIWRLLRLGLGVLLLSQAAVILVAEYHKTHYRLGNHLPPSDAPAIVLGAGHLADGTPDIPGRMRTRLGVRLVLTDRAGFAVFSGGIAETTDDLVIGEAMLAFAIKRGLPPEGGLVEGGSQSTQENLAYSMDLLRERGFDTPPILVTDYVHMARARLLAAYLGIEVAGIAVVPRNPHWKNTLPALYLARENAAWWHNLMRIAVETALRLAGYSDAERAQLFDRVPDLNI
ncbi:MAG: YdcF family protein [Pseudomonadota bacterium]